MFSSVSLATCTSLSLSLQGVDMGAIVDPSQRKSIDEFVQEAKRDGAEVYQAYSVMPSSGCFYPPTLITGVQPVSRCVQEEVPLFSSSQHFSTSLSLSLSLSLFQIFGPVLTVLTFRTPKEAIALANNTRYGLGESHDVM